MVWDGLIKARSVQLREGSDPEGMLLREAALVDPYANQGYGWADALLRSKDGDLKLLEDLCQKHDVNQPLHEDSTVLMQTLLMLNADKNTASAVLTLLRANAHINVGALVFLPNFVMELLNGGDNESYELAKELVSRVPVLTQNPDCLLKAIKTENVDFLNHCLELGLDINIVLPSRETLLVKALRAKSPKMIQWFVDQGGTLRPKNGHHDQLIQNLIVGSGSHSNHDQKIKDTLMCLFKQPEWFDLLKDPADGKLRVQSLLWAVSTDLIETAKYLLSLGVDAHIASVKDTNLLIMSAWRGHADILRYALEAGIDIDAVDYKGLTALQIAKNSDAFGAPMCAELLESVMEKRVLMKTIAQTDQPELLGGDPVSVSKSGSVELPRSRLKL